MQNYDNYFGTHYGYDFSEKDIENYRKWFLAQWNKIQSYLPRWRKVRILEIWSGIGWFYQFIFSELESDNFEYIGLELDSRAVAFSNQLFPNKPFLNVSLEEYKDPWEGFDFIFAFEVLEHISCPSSAIEKIFSLLTKDGVFMGTSPYPYYKNIIADKTHLSVLHPNNWRRLFEYAGFKKCSIQAWSFFPVLWRINTHLNFIIPFYIWFPYFISTTWIVASKNTLWKESI